MKNTETSEVYLSQRIRESWSVVILYPLAMFIAWIPSQVAAWYVNYLQILNLEYPRHLFLIYDYLTVCNALYGPLLALIFYTKTIDARKAWMNNFKRWINGEEYVEEDNRTTCSSIISIQDSEVSSTSMTWEGLSKFKLWTRNIVQVSSPFSIQHNELDVNRITNNTTITDL
jgi:hypothetical protein